MHSNHIQHLYLATVNAEVKKASEEASEKASKKASKKKGSETERPNKGRKTSELKYMSTPSV